MIEDFFPENYPSKGSKLDSCRMTPYFVLNLYLLLRSERNLQALLKNEINDLALIMSGA